MSFLSKLLSALFGRPTPAQAPTPQVQPPATPPQPQPTLAPSPDPVGASPVTLTRHESTWGPSVMVTLQPGAPETFIRHVLADGTYGQDAGGQNGTLLAASRPSMRVSIRPGSTLYLRPAGTDVSAYRVLARY